MSDKAFQEMTLEEAFDFEAKHSVSLGRSVVTELGFKRQQTKLNKLIQGLRKAKKRRVASKVATA